MSCHPLLDVTLADATRMCGGSDTEDGWMRCTCCWIALRRRRIMREHRFGTISRRAQRETMGGCVGQAAQAPGWMLNPCRPANLYTVKQSETVVASCVSLVSGHWHLRPSPRPAQALPVRCEPCTVGGEGMRPVPLLRFSGASRATESCQDLLQRQMPTDVSVHRATE